MHTVIFGTLAGALFVYGELILFLSHRRLSYVITGILLIAVGVLDVWVALHP